MSTPATKTVVVLGASYAGIPLSHQILRALPTDWNLILINPSTHIYWNIASVRAVAKDSAPGLGPQNSLIHEPFLPGFSQYPSERFTFLQGKATAVNTAISTLTYLPLSDELPDGSAPGAEIPYGHLIVATGSRAPDSWPFKNASPLPTLLASLSASQAKIAAASSIVIGGGGPTSIETAGEIASFFPTKTVTIVSASEHLLPGSAPTKVGATAEKTLNQLGVTIKKGVKVSHYDEVAKNVVLVDGQTIPADLYIPTVGLLPNSEFLPRELVDEHGSIKVNTHLRTTVDNVWAVGDVTNVLVKQAAIIAAQVPVASANVLKAITEDESKKELDFKSYDEGKVLSAIFVPIGSKFGKGTGHIKGWKLFGTLVWLAKGRNLMVGGFKDVALGKTFIGFGKV